MGEFADGGSGFGLGSGGGSAVAGVGSGFSIDLPSGGSATAGTTGAGGTVSVPFPVGPGVSYVTNYSGWLSTNSTLSDSVTHAWSAGTLTGAGRVDSSQDGRAQEPGIDSGR